MTAMFVKLRLKDIGITSRMQGHEGRSEAGREGCYGFNDSTFSTRDLGSVSRKEVIHRLSAAKLGHRWENTECITRQENDIFWVSGNLWFVVVGDVELPIRN